MSELTLNVRALGRARGEREFIRETTLKVRWPRRDGVTWRGWEALRGPELDELMEHCTCYIGESGGVLLGFALWRKDGALAMLYVKQAFRGQRFGLQLLPKTSAQVTDKVTAIGGPPIKVIEPTPCWRRWAEHWGLPYEVTR